MCIAILNCKKAGRLPKSQIKNSWDNNDMGAGLLWNKDNKLNVFKTYDYDEYIDKYNEIRDDNTIGNIVLHFRIATSGYNGEQNLHPFLVNDDLGFVHNGVIGGLGNKSFSDTYEFNDMLKKFKHNFLNCEMSKFFISDYIGHSKLIFLDSKDKYTIIKEELGKWENGNWYSNDSYKEYNDFVYYGNKKVSKTPTNSYVKPLSNQPVRNWEEYYNDVWGEGGEVSVIKDEDLVDEWAMYEFLCEIYGLDMNDDNSLAEIEIYMDLNNAADISELYEIITDGYRSL